MYNFFLFHALCANLIYVFFRALILANIFLVLDTYHNPASRSEEHYKLFYLKHQLHIIHPPS